MLGQFVKSIDPSAEGLRPETPDDIYQYRAFGRRIDLAAFGDIAQGWRNKIALDDWTFGAALARAREALANRR